MSEGTDFDKTYSNSETQDSTQPRRAPWTTLALAGGLAVALGAGVYQHMNMVNLQMETQTLEREIAGIRQTLNTTGTSLTQSLGALRDDLDTSRKESMTSVEKARTEARRQAEAAAKRVSTKLSAEQAEQTKQINDQITQVKTSADSATARLTEITTEVGTVKTDVAATRTDLDKTISDLHRTTGDMGVMSGLIATNSKELAALRELGERDYYEFTLNKKQATQRVGDIQVQLKKADVKRNRYTVDILADDKHVEKKDKGVNEPVQFYVVSKAKQPYELVVNDVKKDVITGYVSVPKVKVAAGRRL